LIRIAITDLRSKCGGVIYLQKICWGGQGAGAMQILAIGLIPVNNEPMELGI
jgi:hypothetical protein